MAVNVTNLRNVETLLEREHGGKWLIAHFSLVWCDVDPHAT